MVGEHPKCQRGLVCRASELPTAQKLAGRTVGISHISWLDCGSPQFWAWWQTASQISWHQTRKCNKCQEIYKPQENANCQWGGKKTPHSDLLCASYADWKLRFPWGRYGHQIDDGKREIVPEDSPPLAGDKRSLRHVSQEVGAGLQNVSTLPSLGSNEEVTSLVTC